MKGIPIVSNMETSPNGRLVPYLHSLHRVNDLYIIQGVPATVERKFRVSLL